MNNTHDNPLISLIIPCYNGEKTLSRAVDSVTSQPCFDLIELIIVNDGSKDGSGAIIDAYAAKYQNIREIYKENGGVSSARNLAMRQAKGKYLAFLDADDWWEPGFLYDEMARELEDSDFEIVAFSYSVVSPGMRFEKLFRVTPGEERLSRMAHHRFSGFSFCSQLYLRSFVNEYGIRFPDTGIGEDQCFAVMCAYAMESVKYIDKIIFTYFTNLGSVTHRVSSVDHYSQFVKGWELTSLWFAKLGEDYDFSVAVLNKFASSIGGICASRGYRSALETVSRIEYYDTIRCYADYPVRPRVRRIIGQWLANPRLFWLKSQLFVRPIHAIKRLLHSYPHLRAFPDWLYYRVIKKYEKTGMQT